MAKVVSLKQQEANRRNAQRSTGSKTAAGKHTVRWNALEHGLLARAVVIPRSGEDEGEYQRLLAGLVDSLQPVGSLEGLIVEDIAATYWRRRRTIRAEAGEIEQHIAWARDERDTEQAETLETAKVTRAVSTLEESAAGLQVLIDILDAAATDLRADGQLSEENVAWLEAGWQWDDDERAAMRGATAPTEEIRKRLLEFLRDTRKEFCLAKQAAEAREAGERDMRAAQSGTPDTSSSEGLLRYETAMDRKLHAAIAQLERLQRRRRGDIVPPPTRRRGDVA